MPKRESGLEVDVPDQCFEVKARYWEWPSKEVIKQIKDFILMSGQPYMWPGHTHTRPPVDGVAPIYLDEFALPEKFRRTGRWSPCPCCWPRHAKFGHGKIAWFPSEGVIRLIGPDCFAALNKEQHEQALAELRQRKQREADVAYLFRHHDVLVQSYTAMQQARPVAVAIEEFSRNLWHTIEERLDLRLWDHVRQGQGYLTVWDTFRDLKKDGTAVELTEARSYAKVLGYQILKPARKSFSFQVDQVLQVLSDVGTNDDWLARVSGMSDLDKHSLAKLMSNSIKKGRELVKEMQELQTFVSTVNIATLRTWGGLPENQMPMAIERCDMALRIGKKETAKFSIAIPDHLEDPLSELKAPLIKELLERGV